MLSKSSFVVITGLSLFLSISFSFQMSVGIIVVKQKLFAKVALSSIAVTNSLRR